MSGTDGETKRKLREMGAAALLEALESEDEHLVLGMGFNDSGYASSSMLRLTRTFNHAKVEGLIRRAGLRYPRADLRRAWRSGRRTRAGSSRSCSAGYVFVHRASAERGVPGLHRVRKVLSGVRAGEAGLSTSDPSSLHPYA